MLDFHKLHYFNDCGNSGTRTHTLLKHQILSLAWLPITAYSLVPFLLVLTPYPREKMHKRLSSVRLSCGVRWTQTNDLISMNDAL